MSARRNLDTAQEVRHEHNEYRARTPHLPHHQLLTNLNGTSNQSPSLTPRRTFRSQNPPQSSAFVSHIRRLLTKRAAVITVDVAV